MMRVTTMYQVMAMAAFAFLLVPDTAHAQEKPAKLETFTFRIMGLFSPERVKDFEVAIKNLEPDGITLVSVNYDEAEATFSCDVKKAFGSPKPDQIAVRLHDRVGSTTRYTFNVKPRRTLPKDKLQHVVIPVAGLDCVACSYAAYEMVAKIEGVEIATSSFKEGKVNAWFDPSKTNVTQLVEALRKGQVDVRVNDELQKALDAGKRK